MCSFLTFFQRVSAKEHSCPDYVLLVLMYSSPEILGCISLTHAVTVFRGNMPSAIKKSKVAVSAADSGKKKNKVEKYFMDNSGVDSFCLREGVKKKHLFGTLSQTSDPTHPPRTFGTPLSEK